MTAVCCSLFEYLNGLPRSRNMAWLVRYSRDEKILTKENLRPLNERRTLINKEEEKWTDGNLKELHRGEIQFCCSRRGRRRSSLVCRCLIKMETKQKPRANGRTEVNWSEVLGRESKWKWKLNKKSHSFKPEGLEQPTNGRLMAEGCPVWGSGKWFPNTLAWVLEWRMNRILVTKGFVAAAKKNYRVVIRGEHSMTNLRCVEYETVMISPLLTMWLD